MRFILILLGILLILSGFYLLVNPDLFSDIFTDNMENTSFYIGAIVFRAAFGVLLIYAAKQSKFPKVITFIGYLALLAALIFIFIGHDGFQDFVSGLLPFFKDNIQMTALFIMAFGAFFIYAFMGKEKQNG